MLVDFEWKYLESYGPESRRAAALCQREHLLDPRKRVASLLFAKFLKGPTTLDVVERDRLSHGVVGPEVVALGQKQPSLPV